MSDSDALEQPASSQTAIRPRMGYSEAICELLELIRYNWGYPAHEEGMQTNKNEKENTPFDNFIGFKVDFDNIKPLIIGEVDYQEAQGSLRSWLEATPFRLFSAAAYELGCVEIDQAKTQEAAIKLFLKHFGYREVSNIELPEGVFTAIEDVRKAKETLDQGKEDDVEKVRGIGISFADAVESTLQVLALFYGQYLMPDVFGEYLQRQEELMQDDRARIDWWRRALQKVIPSVNQSQINLLLVKHRTQMELLIQLLKSLNEYVSSEPDILQSFHADFRRDTIFPVIDGSKLPKNVIGVPQYDFLDQMTAIKDLRNQMNHAVQLLKDHKVRRQPQKIKELAQQLSFHSSFFLELGKVHKLFPKVLLITGKGQDINGKWKITALDEKGEAISFYASEEKQKAYVPRCDMYCWPAEDRFSTPSVALIAHWRR